MSIVDIPTLDGNHISVSAANVFRVTRGIEKEGSGGLTRVEYGARSQLTNKPALEIVHLLRQAGAKLVELTAPDGTPIYLALGFVSSVENATDRDPPGAVAAVLVAGRRQSVRQTQQLVNDALAEAAQEKAV